MQVPDHAALALTRTGPSEQRYSSVSTIQPEPFHTPDLWPCLHPCAMTRVVNEAFQIPDSPVQRLQTSGNVSPRSLSEVVFSVSEFLNHQPRSSVTGTPTVALLASFWVQMQLNTGKIFQKTFSVSPALHNLHLFCTLRSRD